MAGGSSPTISPSQGDGAIGGVVFAAGAVSNEPAMFGPKRALIAATGSDDLATSIAASRAFLRACFAVQPDQDDFETMLAFNAMVPPAVRAAMGGRTTDYDAVLRALRVPVLAIHGEADAIILPAMSRHIAATVPGARAVFYEGVGHSPFWEAHERFDADLAAFLKATSPLSGSEPAGDVGGFVEHGADPRAPRVGCEGDPVAAFFRPLPALVGKLRVRARRVVEQAPTGDDPVTALASAARSFLAASARSTGLIVCCQTWRSAPVLPRRGGSRPARPAAASIRSIAASRIREPSASGTVRPGRHVRVAFVHHRPQLGLGRHRRRVKSSSVPVVVSAVHRGTS